MRFFAIFIKISKSVTGRKLQHIRAELYGVIGAEHFGKILIMNRELKVNRSLSLRRAPTTKRIQSMTNPVKSRFYGIFYFSSRTSISNSGYIISNLDTYIINNTRYFCIAITIGFICFN